MMVRFILLILSAASDSPSPPVEISCSDDGWVEIEESEDYRVLNNSDEHPSFVSFKAKKISSLEVKCQEQVMTSKEICNATIGLDDGTQYTIYQKGEDYSTVRQTIKELRVCQQKRSWGNRNEENKENEKK